MALNVGAFVAMRLYQQSVERYKKQTQPKQNCSKCSHVGQETTDDVACCNCCEDGEFYDEVEEDPFNENDPYVVTNPMAFY